MEFYVTIFVFLYLLSCAEMFTNIDNATKKIIVIIMSTMFVLLSTFYYGRMGDYITYMRYYNVSVDTSHIYNIFTNQFEYAYELLMVFSKSIGLNYVGFRFLLAIITMSILAKVYIRGEDGVYNKYPLTLMFIVWALNFGDIFIIRSTIATAICIYSVKYIVNKDVKNFLITTIIAALFHRLCILWSIAYYIFYEKRSKKVIALLILLVIVFSRYLPTGISYTSMLFGSTIEQKVTSYVLRGTEHKAGANYTTAFLFFKASANGMILICLFAFLIYAHSCMNDKNRMNGLLNIFWVGFFLQFCTLQVSSVIARLAAPFISVQFFLLLKTFDIRYKNLFSKYFVHTILSIYLLLRMVVFVNSSGYIPFTIKF